MAAGPGERATRGKAAPWDPHLLGDEEAVPALHEEPLGRMHTCDKASREWAPVPGAPVQAWARPRESVGFDRPGCGLTVQLSAIPTPAPGRPDSSTSKP